MNTFGLEWKYRTFEVIRKHWHKLELKQETESLPQNASQYDYFCTITQPFTNNILTLARWLDRQTALQTSVNRDHDCEYCCTRVSNHTMALRETIELIIIVPAYQALQPHYSYLKTQSTPSQLLQSTCPATTALTTHHHGQAPTFNRTTPNSQAGQN